MEVGSDAAGRCRPGERVMALCSGGAYAEQVPLQMPYLLEVVCSSSRDATAWVKTCLTVRHGATLQSVHCSQRPRPFSPESQSPEGQIPVTPPQ